MYTEWTDEKLYKMLQSGSPGPRNQAEILLKIPAYLRDEARSEATRQSNMTGDRFTDGLRSYLYSIS